MKTPIQKTLTIISTSLCLTLSLAVRDARAAVTNLWWDNNGASVATSGIWDNTSLRWSTTSSLTASPIANANGNFPEFAAGTSPISSLTITVNSAVTCAGMADGLSGPTVTNLTFSGTGSIGIVSGVQGFYTGPNSADTVTFNVPLTGAGQLQQHSSGALALYTNNSYSGGTSTTGGQLIYYNNSNSFGTGPVIIGGTGGAMVNGGASAVVITNSVSFNTAGWNLNLASGLPVGGAPGTTWSGPWTIPSGNTTLLTGGTGQVTEISGAIGGSGAALAVGDPGTLELGGVNTYTGGTTLTNNLGTPILSIFGSGSLGSGSYAGNITNAGGIFIYNSSASQTLSGVVSGAGSFTQAGSGTLTLTGANTYTGNTTNSGGTILLVKAETAGTSGPLGKQSATAAGTIIMSGGTLKYTSTNKNDYSGRFSTAASQKYNADLNGQAVTWATALTSSGGTMSVSDSGSGGVLTLSGANTYTGNTTISSGSVAIGGSVVTPFGNGAGTINLAGGNIVVTGDRSTTANNLLNPVSLSASSQFQSAGTTGTRNLVFGGPFTTTAGTLTIHETGTSAGPAIFNMRFTNTFTFSRPITFQVDTAGHSINLDIWNRSDLGDQTYSGVISGPGSIKRSITTANTGGRVILTGTNTFTGGTSLNDGEIALGSDCAGAADAPTSGPLGTGTVSMGNDAGKLSASGAARNLFNHFLFTSSGQHFTLQGANDLTLSGNIDLGGLTNTVTNINTGVSTLSGTISNGTFTYQGNTTLLLAGTNTYTGKTTVGSGTLALSATGSINNSTNLVIAAGATLDVSAIPAFGFSGTAFSASGNASLATIKGASGGTVNLGSSSITLAFDGTDPSLVVSQGTLTLNGNAFTVNGSPLAPGTYTIISQSTGSITSSGSFTVSGTAIGAGTSGLISVSGGNVVLTVITRATFSSLTASPSIIYGASSVALAGTVSAAGPVYPANGETVNVTINGNTQSTTINDSTGDFSINYLPPTIPASGTPYTITYSYGGNLTLGPTNDTSTTLTVGPASLSVTASNQTKVYGQTLATTGSTAFSSLGLVNGETIGTVTLAVSGGGAASNAPVSGSPYTITPSAAAGGTFNANNYAIGYNAGALTVTPAALTVTADNYSIAFGATNPVLTASYTNFVNGETLGTSDVGGSPALTTGVTTNSDAGSYAITNSLGTLTSTNYSFNLVNGTLTVTNALSTNVVTTDVNPALPGALVTLTSTLSTLAPSLAVPQGTVQFLTNGMAYGSPVTLTNGAAAITSTTLAHGSNTIEADFAGTTNISGGTNIVGSTNTAVVVINTPPVAGAASYQRPADEAFKIAITNLVAHATDADGDPLTLLSVSATSTNGATVTTDANFVYYTPPVTNGNVTDTFLYSVSDNFGATNQNVVTVTILADNTQSVNITGLATLGDGSAEISFAGIPNRTYLIQATTNLTPTIIWTTLSTNTAGTNGLFQYNDLDSTNFPTRYYRTTTP